MAPFQVKEDCMALYAVFNVAVVVVCGLLARAIGKEK